MKRLVYAFCLMVGFFAVQTSYAANIEHVVQQGDTLYHISKEYGVPVDILLKANHISNARSLRIGMRLNIPDTYRVKKGDTLYSIAKDNGIPLPELLHANHITNSHLIKIGEVLVLPPASVSPLALAASARRADSTPATGSGKRSPTVSSLESTASMRSVSPNGNNAPFWPAPGKRTFLSGKLTGGTQIAGQVGDPVYSVASGKVVWVGPYRGYGRVVFVESPAKYIYVYGGNETTLVKVGDAVNAGTEVANMGINPHLGYACAYFFVYRNGHPVSPKTAPRG